MNSQPCSLPNSQITVGWADSPLEFAVASGIPEAVDLTDKYNRVRFGQKGITPVEADEIEHWLSDLEKGQAG